jgi:hypothetical protein
MYKSSRSPRKHLKRVHFAGKHILDSPVAKSFPSVKPSTIKFGSFVFDLYSDADSVRSTHERRGILKKPGPLPDEEVIFHKEGNNTLFSSLDCSLGQDSGNVSPSPEGSRIFHNLNCSGNDSSPLEDSRCFLRPSCLTANKIINSTVHLEVIDNARRLGKCTQCFSLNHRRLECRAPLRCAACFKSGHVFKFCSTLARPKIYWRPKSAHALRPRMETHQSSSEGDESGGNRVLPPIYSESAENPNSNGELASPLEPESPRSSSTEAPSGEVTEEMANFEVDPAPFVLEGMNVEDWARSARGRIIIAANPPRRHEEYAIISIDPPPPANQIYEAINEVLECFEDEHGVRFRSCYPSPLGLCLAQFPLAIARQAMINLSPHHIGNGRELRVVEHDRGINLRNSPFSRTCWVLFLAFPLDFQTRDILQQAVGLFGSVVTWTDNSRFRSRILLRCRVTFVSRIPRSIVIIESGMVADGGHSWTVPVFVLESNPNDVLPGDEDLIPPNGNPHLGINQQMDVDHQGHFEDVGDLQDVQQANIDQGWQIPSPPHPAQNDGWDE